MSTTSTHHSRSKLYLEYAIQSEANAEAWRRTGNQSMAELSLRMATQLRIWSLEEAEAAHNIIESFEGEPQDVTAIVLNRVSGNYSSAFQSALNGLKARNWGRRD